MLRPPATPLMDTTRTQFRFGRYLLQPAQRRLLCDGEPVKLGARAFDVLQALVEQRQRHLPKAELIERVWPDVVVEENNLEVQVWALRKILGATAIATIPGRGYRFTLPLDDEALPVPAPVAANASRRDTLPARLPPLIGRDSELAALRHAVDEYPLVTLTGVGGMGKSLLAQHLLVLERDTRPHGVCWVDLAALVDPALVCAAIAGALGLSLGAGEPHRALALAVAPLKILLALDNAEHLVDAVAAAVRTLIESAPGVHLVVTSQLPLKLAQERVLRLGPLATPPDAAHAALDAREAMTYGAVALFAERVAALQPRFVLGEDNVAEVCELCRRLDGSPLAIGLAAARVPVLGVAALARALDERLQLLTKGARGAPARQLSLRAALEWSYALLGPDERCAFRRLAVFAGSFTLELAQQVCSDAALDRWQLLAALDALVDHSLVAVQDGEPLRYRLLESPQALAREQLAASDEQATLQERHARAVQALLHALNHDFAMDRLRRDRLLALTAPDLDNGRAAMAWALQHDAALALGLVTPLTNVLGRMRGAEGRRLWPATEPLLHDGLPAELRLEWLTGAALFHFSDYQNARAVAFARRALALARELGDPRRMVLALGIIAARDEQAGPAERDAAMREMRERLTPDLPLLTRVNAAQTEFVYTQRSGDVERAEAVGQRWLALTREPGWEYDHVIVLTNMADLALVRGDVAQAVQLGRELERQLEDSRLLRSLTVARSNLAIALLAAGETAQVRAVAERGWPMAASWRLQPYWAVIFAGLAAQEGRVRSAAGLLGCAHARLAALGGEPEPNEARALAEAERLARAGLEPSAFDAQREAGAAWDDERLGAAGLARADAPL